jgi:hypothetical protein
VIIPDQACVTEELQKIKDGTLTERQQYISNIRRAGRHNKSQRHGYKEMNKLLISLWGLLKTPNSALRSRAKMLIYNSKLRFCRCRKP